MECKGVFLDAVDPSIPIHSLECSRIRQVPLALAGYLREKRPSVLLANMWPLTTAAILSWHLTGRQCKMFLCDHIVLSEHVKRDLAFPFIGLKAALLLTYPCASGVIAVSDGVARDIAAISSLPERRVHVIYNPVVKAELNYYLPNAKAHAVRSQLWGGNFRVHILTLGSLKTQKNHRMLLQAFSKVAAALDAALVILGEGDLRPILEQDVESLGLNARVVLPGFHIDTAAWFQAADLFVLSSDFEGFANVLAEALAWGVPTLSTDCPHGPSEILGGGLYGELVPINDPDAFAMGIRKALSKEWDKGTLRCRALEFSIPKQAQAYIDLFNV